MQASGNTAPISKPLSRLRELGLVLPKSPTPLGAYVEASGTGSVLFLSGMLPVANGKLAITGRLGPRLPTRLSGRLQQMTAIGQTIRGSLGQVFASKGLTPLVRRDRCGDHQAHPFIPCPENLEK